MTQSAGKQSSLYCGLFKLLVIAFVTAACFFLLTHAGGKLLINSYFERTGYADRENKRKIEELERYVEKNEIAAGDWDRLTAWVDRQQVVWLQVYRDNVLLYDSQYTEMDGSETYYIGNDYYQLKRHSLIEFQDGAADIFLYGMYTYQFLNFALIVEIFLSFLLFLGIVMAGIQKIIRYIKKLSGEIEILESGNLDCEITVQGKDELAALAKGLDNMRKSIRGQIRQEARLMKMNQFMITSLSHDLRTPLTSLMIYSEILRKADNLDTEQARKYIEKIDEKTNQIKEMADCILKYSLQKKTAEPDPEKPDLEKPQTLKTIFYDLMSELFSHLEKKGYEVSWDLEWREESICVNPDYIIRIFDNITSNLIKYANQEKPVGIRSLYTDTCGGFVFKNEKKRNVSGVDSTKIGLLNVKNMMEEMGGSCEIRETESQFEVYLLFRWRREENI